ncbi:hypothetical protein [Ekhidna sp.]|uniref:hypothetical protein n=1 Tax=Ekhidna sp. TaxID=2608089 RepID=UPI003BAA41A2
MKVSEKEILFIYNSADLQQREALAYAKSLKHYVIKELEIQKDQLTQLHLATLAKRLSVPEKDLIKPDFEMPVSGVLDLDTHDFLDYLSSNLRMLRTPIAVFHDHAIFIESPYAFIKEDNINST